MTATATAREPQSAELAGKARSGVLWVTGLNVFRDVLQFGTMLVLVRLLAPKAYGEFSLISSVMVFFTVFSFRSFLEHTLQLRPGEFVDYQSHFTAGAFMQARHVRARQPGGVHAALPSEVRGDRACAARHVACSSCSIGRANFA